VIPGRVHDTGDLAETGARGGDGRGDRFLVGDVAPDAHRFGQARGSLRSSASFEIEDRDHPSLVSEAACHRSADSRAAAGDEQHLALESHQTLLPSGPRRGPIGILPEGGRGKVASVTDVCAPEAEVPKRDSASDQSPVELAAEQVGNPGRFALLGDAEAGVRRDAVGARLPVECDDLDGHG